LIFGFGPGRQFDAHPIISRSLYGHQNVFMVGRRMAFHALPLQIIAEIGLMGASFLYFLIFRIYIRTKKFYKKTKILLPVIGIIGWFSVGLSVSSFDPFAGLFLGLAFIPFFEQNINKTVFK
jgi:hypothetical protein